MNDQLMTRAEVASLLQVPVATLAAWAYKRSGPPFMRLGKHTRYDRVELEAWMTRQRVEPAK